jgi:hypothetical protein
MTVSKKVCATYVAVYGWPRGRKCATFENQFVTVRMTDFPWTLGSPLMKSSVMSA